MKTVTLSATFDGQNIRLEEDDPLRKDARLLVAVGASRLLAGPTSPEGRPPS